MAWYRPQNLTEALTVLENERPQIVSGGTDLFVSLTVRQELLATDKKWLDIQNLPELRLIEKTNEGIEIGAGVTAAEIWQSPVLQQAAALQQAARVVGGWQIQNRATIGGNIANASPAADMVVPLAALNARVTVASINGKRNLPILDIITGPKQTLIKENELITSILIPEEYLGAPQIFLRHDQRGGTDISLVSVAAVLNGNEKRRIAVGAANFKPFVLDAAQLPHGEWNQENLERMADSYAEAANPITDIRASAEYRRAMVKVFVKRAISELLQ